MDVLKNNRPRVAVIVRVSAKDGMGHFYRVLGLVPALEDLFVVQVFIVGDGDIVQGTSGDLAALNWIFCNSDRACASKVSDWRADMVVFDTLRFDEISYTSIRQKSRTVSISPVFEHLSDTDVIIHRTSEAPPNWNETSFSAKVYKGINYTLVSPKVLEVDGSTYLRALKEPKLNIGVSMGGADALNDTLKILKSLGTLHKKAVFWVVLGAAYGHAVDPLMDVARENLQEIIVVRTSESMWRVLRNTSVVITAGGMTTYEAAMAGIPSITVLRDPSSHFLVSELEKAGATQVIEFSQVDRDHLTKTLNSLVVDRDALIEMRKAAQVLGISDGSRAVAKVLFEEVSNMAEQREVF